MYVCLYVLIMCQLLKLRMKEKNYLGYFHRIKNTVYYFTIGLSAQHIHILSNKFLFQNVFMFTQVLLIQHRSRKGYFVF